MGKLTSKVLTASAKAASRHRLSLSYKSVLSLNSEQFSVALQRDSLMLEMNVLLLYTAYNIHVLFTFSSDGFYLRIALSRLQSILTLIL